MCSLLRQYIYKFFIRPGVVIIDLLLDLRELEPLEYHSEEDILHGGVEYYDENKQNYLSRITIVMDLLERSKYFISCLQSKQRD